MTEFDKKCEKDFISDDDEWVTADEMKLLDPSWMEVCFPNKSAEKRQKWLQILLDNEFEAVEDLKTLNEEDWKKLCFPLAVESRIREVVKQSTSRDLGVPMSETNVARMEERAISQVDVIVVDISGSMKARSALDVDKTREDVSKMLFHSLIDQLICLELHHAVGLLAFGEYMHPFSITTDYEQFHQCLGRLDANEGSTKLYDSIYHAGELIENFIVENSACHEGGLKKRIFVLTDGEDNISKYQPWQVAQFLQQRNIYLDAIPIAKYDQTLHSVCAATKGICFRTTNQEQAMSLFESEATLHLAHRNVSEAIVEAIVDAKSLKSLEDMLASNKSSNHVITEMKSSLPSSIYQPAMKVSDIAKVQVASSIPGQKRIISEYLNFQKKPATGWNVYIDDDNIRNWKAILSGNSISSPYSQGKWLLTINFPDDYPFRPPKVVFVTPIYHCNISNSGNICLDVLKDCWNPALTVTKVLLSISSMLLNPNPDDPMDAFKGQLYRDSVEAYMKEAEQHTQLNASGENDIIEKLLATSSNNEEA